MTGAPSTLGAKSVRGSDRVLTFRTGGQRYSLAAEAVAEVVRLPQTTRVPHAPQAVLGLANIRGSVVPVVSAGALLAGQAETASRLLLLAGAECIGLAVDSVGEIVSAAQAHDAQPIDVGALLARLTIVEHKRRVARAAVAPAQTKQAGTKERLAFVTFEVGGQLFALPLAAVEEVLPLPGDLTVMPHADAAVVGSVAWRGAVLPLLSLRALLSLSGQAEVGVSARVVVVRIGAQRVGLIVDALRAVLRVAESEIDPVPAALSRGSAEARIQAICRVEGGKRLVSVLAAEHLLREDITSRLLQARSEGSDAMVTAGADAAAEQFLLFRLGDDSFALPIAVVEEVAAMPEALARLPKAPAFVRGVINLRGQVVPVIDQAQRFGAAVRTDKRRRIVVVQMETLKAGFIVDDIIGVVAIPADRIEAAPSFASEETRIFERVARLPGSDAVALVVSPGELVGRAERDLLAAAGGKGAARQP